MANDSSKKQTTASQDRQRKQQGGQGGGKQQQQQNTGQTGQSKHPPGREPDVSEDLDRDQDRASNAGRGRNNSDVERP